jgi:hypothetical protein
MGQQPVDLGGRIQNDGVHKLIELKPGQQWRDKDPGQGHYIYRVADGGDCWIAWCGPNIEAIGTKEFLAAWLHEHAELVED